MNEKDLKTITSRKGYSAGIPSTIKSGVRSQFEKNTFGSPPNSKREVPDLERGTGHESLGKERFALKYSGRCTVRFKVFRRRLCDPDGNCTKYLLDALRYAGALEDDSERHIRLIYEGQEKVETNEEERVEVVLEYEEINLDDLWRKTL